MAQDEEYFGDLLSDFDMYQPDRPEETNATDTPHDIDAPPTTEHRLSPSPPTPPSEYKDMSQVFEDTMASTPMQLVRQEVNFGDMTAEQQLQCRKQLGYCPPDIMEGAFALQLKQRFPGYDKALKLGLTRPSCEKMNDASQAICRSLMLIKTSRNLLQQALAGMGKNAEGRDTILKCAMDINNQLDGLNIKIYGFVRTMTRISHEVGAVSTLITYGAGVAALKDRIDNLQEVFAQEIHPMQEAVEQAQTPIKDVQRFVLNSLHSQIHEHEEVVNGARELWENALRELEKAADVFQQARKIHDLAIAEACAHKAAAEYNLQIAQSEERELKTRFDNLSQKIDERMNQIERLSELQTNSNPIPKLDMQSIKQQIYEEIQCREQSKTEQISIYQRRLDEKLKDAAHLERKAAGASDGYEMKKGFTTQRYALIFSRQVPTLERRLVGEDEQSKLRNAAKICREEAQNLSLAIKNLEESRTEFRNSIRANIMQNAQKALRVEKNHAAAHETDRRKLLEERKMVIRRDLQVLEGVKNNLAEEIRKVSERAAEFMRVLEKTSKTIEFQSNALEAVKRDKGIALEECEREEALRRKHFEKVQDDMFDDFKKFDVNNNQQFTALVQILQAINTSVENLPIAMQDMSQAFNLIYTSLGKENFLKGFATLPSDRQIEYLSDVSKALQAICQVGSLLIQLPMRKLVLNAVESLASQQTLPVPEDSVVIEEVEDGKPFVDKEKQEQDVSRRRRNPPV